MIRKMAYAKTGELIDDFDLSQTALEDAAWLWVDLVAPDATESKMLKDFFLFHDLNIEDCLDNALERPKVDVHRDYRFFVLHGLNQNTLEPVELNIFVGNNYIVTHCKVILPELSSWWQQLWDSSCQECQGPEIIAYRLLDAIIDSYYPAIYRIDDNLGLIEIKSLSREDVDKVYDIRTDILKLRRIIGPMKELVYHLVGMHPPDINEGGKFHYGDIYDHIQQQWDLLEANREIAADIRESYISIKTDTMNQIMTVLTLITSLFIPMSLIAGIYGMNFRIMPELQWQYGYFFALGLMVILAVGMLSIFWRRGWLNFKKW